MSTVDNPQLPIKPNSNPLPAPELLKKLAIWSLFLAFLYLTRDFFFTGFMTFLFSYLILGLVGWCMKRLSLNQDKPGLRRLLTLAVFIVIPLVLVGVAILIAPALLRQGQQLGGWLSQVNPESEVSRLFENYVGPAEFKNKYTGPQDPAYQQDLEKFRASEVLHVNEYHDFPHLEAWVGGAFNKNFTDAARAGIHSRLSREGVSSKEFEKWFLTVKLEELKENAKNKNPDKVPPAQPLDPLVPASLFTTPEKLLILARGNPTYTARLREEWIQDTVKKETTPGSPAYLAAFQKYYEERAKESPTAIPYTFQQYIDLQKVRSQGPVAFGAAMESLFPTPIEEREAHLRVDFEAAKKHELFREWWASSSAAKFVRHQFEASSSEASASRLQSILSSLLNLPVDVGTALLLSLFICIDFPQLQRAVRRLRETWLCDVYDEIAPALDNLGRLIGRAMQAQGLIALCNAILMFAALTFLGVEHTVLLSCAVFVLCLVPTLGMIIAWILIAAVALVQPGGGLALALKVTGAVFLVVLLETFVFSPRILGRMMELHPVLIISLLPVAQYFFGVWGLILATPVAVYVIHVLILRKGLPGNHPKIAAPGFSSPIPNHPPSSLVGQGKS